jgi:hypothetical protein
MRTQNRAKKGRARKGRVSKKGGRKGKLNFQLGVGWNSGSKSRVRNRDVLAVTAPSAVGFTLPSATFNIIGRPLATADYDTTRGIRISGSGLASFSITNNNRNASGLFDNNAVPPAPRQQFYIPVVPGNIDPRLYQIAKTFQFYAFRELKLVYVPAIGTTYVNNLAWGISQDAEEFLQIPNPTQQQVLEFNTAGTTPAWQTSTLQYHHPGTKTWTTNYTGSEPGPVSQFYQAQICAVFSNTRGVGEGDVVTGTVYVTYVIDLYEPQPVDDLIAGHASNPENGYIGHTPEDMRICRLEEELRELLLRCHPHTSPPLSPPLPALESKEDFPDLPSPLVRSPSVLLSPILL